MTRPRPRLLIIGCGDVGLRVLRLLSPGWQVRVLTTQAARRGELRARGALPLVGDLDDPATLGRLAALADAVLVLAPPPSDGDGDPRTHRLVRVLARGGSVRRVVYVSTSGVYGDCGGERVDETRTPNPATARARRRVAAEALWRWYARRSGVALTVLRAPGIYALDRAGGDPRERVRRGTPVLRPEDDVHTNHIHADDLALACVLALHRGPSPRAINVSDDGEMRMGDHFEAVARRFGLPPPPRISRAEAQRKLSPMQMSFLSESRRLDNTRLKRELRLALRYPTVEEGLAAADLRTADAP